MYVYPCNLQIHQLSKLLTFQGPEVVQLSSSMHKLVERFDSFNYSIPFPEDVYRNESTLITYGGRYNIYIIMQTFIFFCEFTIYFVFLQLLIGD
jgi:hypothetical protein